MIYKVALYSSEKCGFCLEQQNWMKQNNISFELKDISEEKHSNEFKALNIPAVPFTIITTNTDVISLLGFQKHVLEEILI